jgi:hypothetical protein
VVVAQSLVESGGLASVVAAFQSLAASVQQGVTETSATTWIVVGVALVIGVRLWSSRGAR